MFRIKIGDNTTVNNITKGPRIVLECDTVNEVVDLITACVFDHILDVEERASAEAKSAKSTIKRL